MGNPFAPPPHDARPAAPESRTDSDRSHSDPSTDSDPRNVGDHPTGTVRTAPAPGPPREPEEPVDPALVSDASRHVMRFSLLMLAALLTSTLPLPARLLSVVVAVAALVVGVRAMRRARRARVRGMLVVALAAGMGMTAVVGLSTLVVVTVWDVEMERQTCEARAITNSARLDCRDTYEKGLQERQDELRP